MREASETLGLSYRQAKRVWERYRAEPRGPPRIRVHSCAFVVLTDSTLGAALDIWNSSTSRRFFAHFHIAAQPFHPPLKSASSAMP